MFDFAWSEIALVGVVALVLIGPKDMPVAIRTVTDLIKRGRRMAGEFQTHVDEMVREANLHEVRDQINDLRSLNIRSQIARAVDGDGSLRRSLSDNPVSAGASAAPAVAPAPVASGPSVAALSGAAEPAGAAPVASVHAEPLPAAAPAGVPRPASGWGVSGPAAPAAATPDAPAPAFMPPGARPPPVAPAFVPPARASAPPT